MIVIGVIALVTGSAAVGFRRLARTDLRTTAIQMAGAMRYLFDRASTTGKMHRLVVDFEEGRYWAEVSDDRYYMPSDRETEETREKEAEERVREQEKAEQGEGEEGGDESGIDYSRYQPQEFKPQRARFSAFKDTVTKTVEVKGRVKLAGLFTPRLLEPMASGRGYVYFFPLGMTEAALVYLSDPSGESVYTLVVHPLTGKVKVVNQHVQAPVEEQFDDAGERIER